jgi:hypothetical protein
MVILFIQIKNKKNITHQPSSSTRLVAVVISLATSEAEIACHSTLCTVFVKLVNLSCGTGNQNLLTTEIRFQMPIYYNYSPPCP